MGDNFRNQLYQNLNQKKTKELIHVWQERDTEQWDEMVFDIIRQILIERLGRTPPLSVENQIWQIRMDIDRYLQDGDFDTALAEAERAIEMAPGSALADTIRGRVFYEMGQFERALIDFRAAIQLDVKFEEAWEYLLAAEKELEDVFHESPAKNHLDQALEYYYNADPQQAVQSIELAKPVLPDLAVAYNYLGLILEEMGQVEGALEAYKKSVQMNPRFSAGRTNLYNAMIKLEGQMYRRVAENPVVQDEQVEHDPMEMEESEIAAIMASDVPIPQWFYLDEKSFFLRGWPGHRTLLGRSGYDPLDNDFEGAHMFGVIIRASIDRKMRTEDPLSLLMMLYLGLLLCLPFVLVADIFYGNWYAVLALFVYSPYLLIGSLILSNVILSMQDDIWEDRVEDGKLFF
jgi:tetratricopeptide (TPR) repeat protein